MDTNNEPRYVELSLQTRQVRGVCQFEVKAEIGRPRRGGRSCVAAGVLSPDALAVEFAKGTRTAAVGPIRAKLDISRKTYQELRRGLEEVFCATAVLRVEKAKAGPLRRRT